MHCEFRSKSIKDTTVTNASSSINAAPENTTEDFQAVAAIEPVGDPNDID